MNAMTEMNGGSAVAMAGGYDPFAAYGQEAASGGGDFLKFSKGEWLKGQNGDEVALGTRLAGNVGELAIGWIRWSDGKPAERRFGMLAHGHRPETRDQLGYTDQSMWERDAEGKPVDPWTFTNELPMANTDTGEQMTFSASSKGGIGAIGNLCKAYAAEYRQRPDMVPIIELGRDSYMHPVYKKTYVPVLKIVGWVANGDVPVAPSNDEDAPAAEEKPAAQKAAGSKTRF